MSNVATSERSVSRNEGLPVSREDLSADQPHRHEHAFAFEEDLTKSRAYRHAGGFNTRFSVMSSAGRSTSMSINSSFSLADISKISVFALPIYSTDLSNSSSYIFGDAGVGSAIERMTGDVSKAEGSKPPGRALSLRLRTYGLKVTRKQVLVNADTSIYDPTSRNVFGVAPIISIKNSKAEIILADQLSLTYGYISFVVASFGSFLKENGTYQCSWPVRKNVPLVCVLLSAGMISKSQRYRPVLPLFSPVSTNKVFRYRS